MVLSTYFQNQKTQKNMVFKSQVDKIMYNYSVCKLFKSKESPG